MGVKTVYDSSLTAVADAIRAKTGKSASMEFPTEFVSEIGSISGGATSIVIDSDNSSFENLYPDFDSYGIKTLTLHMKSFNNRSAPKYIGNICVETLNIEYATGYKPSGMRDFARGSTRGSVPKKMKTINLVNVDTSSCSDWFSAFIGIFDGVTINGTLDMTSYSSGNPFGNGTGIIEIRFKANALAVGMTIANNNQKTWSNDTWVSFANSLKAGVTETLTIGSTVQTRLSSIMGTVADGAFTLDSGGSVSLQSFITNTKGWTLA